MARGTAHKQLSTTQVCTGCVTQLAAAVPGWHPGVLLRLHQPVEVKPTTIAPDCTALCSADALTFLPAAQHPAEAGRLHSNRALCLLKLAHQATNPASQAAASHGTPTAGHVESPSGAAHASSSTAAQLAAAAVQDCTAALTCCDKGLVHKVRTRHQAPGTRQASACRLFLRIQLVCWALTLC